MTRSSIGKEEKSYMARKVFAWVQSYYEELKLLYLLIMQGNHATVKRFRLHQF